MSVELDKSTTDRSLTAERTRQVYEKQHNMYLKDDRLFARFLNMYSDLSYYHLTEDDLKGKRILDAGCGNTAYFQLAMHRFGVASQACLELGDNWIPLLKNKLTELSVPLDGFQFVPGSTDDLPFEDQEFDFVSSNGVLVHLNDVEQAEQAFSELARVTKSGGHMYVVLGATGGIFEEEVFPAVRRFYGRNPAFKQLVDNLNPGMIEGLLASLSQRSSELSENPIDYQSMAELFDYDFCAFVQNVIQAPTRHCVEMDEAWVTSLFDRFGFEQPKRCRRFVERKNIRKYFSVLHYDLQEPVSQVLYGGGNMEWIAKKK